VIVGGTHQPLALRAVDDHGLPQEQGVPVGILADRQRVDPDGWAGHERFGEHDQSRSLRCGPVGQ